MTLYVAALAVLVSLAAADETVSYSAEARRRPLSTPVSRYFVLLAEDEAVVAPLLAAAEAHRADAAAVVVLHGFALERAKQVHLRSAHFPSIDGVQFVPTPDFVGYPAAINAAMRRVPRMAAGTPTVVVILAAAAASSSLVLPQLPAEAVAFSVLDMFGLVQHLSLDGSAAIAVVASDRRGAELDPPSWHAAAPLPMLALSASTFDGVGELDEAYALLGGVAAWLDIAVAKGVRLTTYHAAPSSTVPPSGGAADPPLPVPRTVPTPRRQGSAAQLNAATRVRTAQLDVDNFFLARLRSADVRAAIATTLGLTSGGNLARPDPSAFKTIAVVCVYDDVHFLAPVLDLMVDAVAHVLVLVGAAPWHGVDRGPSPALRIAGSRASNSVSVVSGSWSGESEQRKFGLTMARALPGNYTHCLVVDSDELYDPVELRRMLALAAQHPEYPTFRIGMVTYFGQLRAVVDPPEPLQALWLVSLDRCTGFELREPLCEGNAGADAARVGYIDAQTAVCHHVSYVRTDSDMVHKKLASYEHSHEVEVGWIERVWHRWRREPEMENLHPVRPSAYKRSVARSLATLPPHLRTYYLNRCFDVAKRGEVGSAVESTAVGEDVVVCQSAFAPAVAPLAEADGIAPALAALHTADILVLVVGAGSADVSTLPVFLEIAESVVESARALGHRASLFFCQNLVTCRWSERAADPLVIVVGSHALSGYYDGKGGLAVWSHALLPRDSVLYNFEYVPSGELGNSRWVDDRFATLHERFTLWDYDAYNVDQLSQRFGLKATFVPLGYASTLSRVPQLGEADKDIDVLFYGNHNAHRQSVVDYLSEAGVAVTWPRRAFGDERDGLIARARVVLSLRFWNHTEETSKISRQLYLLANRAAVVAETSGTAAERSYFADGIAFANTLPELAAHCRRLVSHPAERRALADRGLDLARRRVYSDHIESALTASLAARNLARNLAAGGRAEL
jgi:hypothetical protein